jgi:protein-S-isoprenylcysteine O-methyltransferase Ste14
MADLRRRAFAGLAQLLVILSLLLFLPAGTIRFWEAWVYLALFTAFVLTVTLYLLRHDPGLVESRMKVGPVAERQTNQKIIQALATLFFVGLFVVPALDRRFHVSAVPVVLVLAGDALVVAGCAVAFLSLRENSFASSTIEVAANQRVISTGVYAVVRHPLYAGALLLLAATPLALASWWGLALVPPMIAVIAARLVDEERYLARNLAGYEAYRAAVRSRLIPWVW